MTTSNTRLPLDRRYTTFLRTLISPYPPSHTSRLAWLQTSNMYTLLIVIIIHTPCCRNEVSGVQSKHNRQTSRLGLLPSKKFGKDETSAEA